MTPGLTCSVVRMQHRDGSVSSPAVRTIARNLSGQPGPDELC